MGRHEMTDTTNEITDTGLMSAEGPDVEVSDSIAPPPGAPDTPPSAPEGPPPFTDPEPNPIAPDELVSDHLGRDSTVADVPFEPAEITELAPDGSVRSGVPR